MSHDGKARLHIGDALNVFPLGILEGLLLVAQHDGPMAQQHHQDCQQNKKDGADDNGEDVVMVSGLGFEEEILKHQVGAFVLSDKLEQIHFAGIPVRVFLGVVRVPHAYQSVVEHRLELRRHAVVPRGVIQRHGVVVVCLLVFVDVQTVFRCGHDGAEVLVGVAGLEKQVCGHLEHGEAVFRGREERIGGV